MKDFFTKIVRSKFSILYLVLFIGILYMLQEKVIMPMVMKVVESEAFFEKPIEENEPLGKLDTGTDRTRFAMINCREGVKKEGRLPDNAQFSDDSYEVWALGNRQYIVRSKVKWVDPSLGQLEKPYACTVRLTGDDQAKPENWTVNAVDFNAESD